MWIELNDISQLDDIKQQSFKSPIAIFKHSTSCGISRMVKRNFEADIKNKSQVESSIYYLDLLAHRNISNEIAERFGIRHESPQLVIIENGNVKHHASHNSISAAAVK